MKRHWTSSEVSYLLEHAGRESVKRISETLGRSQRSVELKAYRLRKDGMDVSLACPTARFEWCTECATYRTSLDRQGRCCVCSLRKRLQGREDACTNALKLLPPDRRAMYEDQESKRGSGIPRRPMALQSDGNQGRYLREMEAWEHRCLMRQYNAAKKRLERMREAIGANPRKGYEDCMETEN